MKKNIAYWLKKLKQSGRPQTEDDSEEKKKKPGTDYIALMNNAIEDIAHATRILIIAARLSSEQTELHVYVADNLLYLDFVNQDFKTRLNEKLKMENGYSFARCELHEGSCERGTPIGNGVSIRLQDIRTENTHTTQASIDILDGHGTLISGRVEMTAEHCRTSPNRRYNIGVGSRPQLDNGSIRYNEIAIDDNPESPAYEMNKYVSRSHAHIGYSNENGFILCAETGGTPQAGKSTVISRNQQQKPLSHSGVSFPLKDGDQIILSRRVILIFKELPNQ